MTLVSKFMKFDGLYTSKCGFDLPRPIFDSIGNSQDRIIVFDVDGVLINGRKVLEGAKEVIKRASDHFDKVVLWSSSNHYDDFTRGDRKLFPEAHQVIIGAEFSGHNPQRPIKRLKGVSRFPAAITPKADKQIKRRPVERPSNPSVILKAFTKATITKAEKGMYQKPKSKTVPIIGTCKICMPSKL